MPFGKLTAEWRRLPSTKEHIKIYLGMGDAHSHKISDLTTVTYGTNSCTWFHKDVALKFARWLSYVRVNSRVLGKELNQI